MVPADYAAETRTASLGCGQELDHAANARAQVLRELVGAMTARKARKTMPSRLVLAAIIVVLVLALLDAYGRLMMQ